MRHYTQDQIWLVRDIIYAWLVETNKRKDWAFGDMADESSESFGRSGLHSIVKYFSTYLEYNPLTVTDLCDRIKKAVPCGESI